VSRYPFLQPFSSIMRRAGGAEIVHSDANLSSLKSAAAAKQEQARYGHPF
jgi:hypothetical protein